MSDLTQNNIKEIIANLNEAILNAPEEISINVILTGNGAKRFHIVKSLLASTYPELEDEEIDKFIVRSGIERELGRFSEIWNNE
jgi:hypothetical protein